MKTINKLLLTSSLLGAVSLNAVSYEYPSLYKDPRVMGMGGANIAVGGEASALFSNPAGLANMKKEEGLELDLLNLNGQFSTNAISLMSDMGDAADETAMLTVFEKYQGSNNHIGFNDFSSVSYRHTDLAWSVGVLAGLQLNFATHALASTSGLIEINAYVLTPGIVGGLSYDFTDNFHLGLGLKSLTGKSIKSGVTLSQLLTLTNDSSTFIEDSMSDFTSTSFDVGAIYDLGNGYWHPQVGVSVMDIGDTKLGVYGTIPMTVNLGMSIQPKLPFLSGWVIALDYIDALNALDADYDAAMGKKIRLGATVDVFNNSWIQISTSVGSYNQALTYGLETRLSILSVVYSSYVEEIGAYAGQETDRRHNLSLSIGW